LLDDVRSALNKGLALGSEDFRDQVEMLYGQRVKPARMERPKSQVVSDPKRVFSNFNYRQSIGS
jgi:putative transposase